MWDSNIEYWMRELQVPSLAGDWLLDSTSRRNRSVVRPIPILFVNKERGKWRGCSNMFIFILKIKFSVSTCHMLNISLISVYFLKLMQTTSVFKNQLYELSTFGKFSFYLLKMNIVLAIWKLEIKKILVDTYVKFHTITDLFVYLIWWRLIFLLFYAKIYITERPNYNWTVFTFSHTQEWSNSLRK